jgi:cell pole-organizing protein PopZ
MAEKNTKSILESIKKKLNKFDQKATNKMSDLDGEFDYVASAKKEGGDNYASVEPSSPAVAPGQEQVSQPFEPGAIPASIDVSKSKVKQENSDSEEFDLDDESSVKPILDEVANSAQNTDSYDEFEEDDLEDFEEDDLEDFEEEENAFVEESEEVSENLEAEIEDRVLDFDELTQSQSKAGLGQKYLAKKKKEEDGEEDGVLNFDELTQPKYKAELEQKKSAEKVEDESEEEDGVLNFDELTQLKSQAVLEQKESVEEEEEDRVLNFDELTQLKPQTKLEHKDSAEEEEQEAEQEEEQEAEQEEEEQEEEEEDRVLNFDELTQTKSQEEPEQKELVEAEEEKDDDLNFDDLEFEEEAKKDSSQKVEQQAEVDPHDAELDELEREIQKQKELAEEIKKESPKELHLELEDELLGIKPMEVVAPVEKVTEQAIVAQEMPALPKMELKDSSFVQESSPVQVQASNTQIIEKRGLVLDESTVKQTTDSVKKLLDARNVVSGIANFSQSPVLAELAMQMLEPKLEKWLNENLSQMVETIVREEIKKIVSQDH